MGSHSINGRRDRPRSAHDLGEAWCEHRVDERPCVVRPEPEARVPVLPREQDRGDDDGGGDDPRPSPSPERVDRLLYEDRRVAGSSKRGPGSINPQVERREAGASGTCSQQVQDARCAFAGHRFHYRASRRSAPPSLLRREKMTKLGRPASRGQFMLSGDTRVALAETIGSA